MSLLRFIYQIFRDHMSLSDKRETRLHYGHLAFFLSFLGQKHLEMDEQAR